MKLLKTGDPCPCCGQPIKSKDPAILAMLTWISQVGRLPTMDELKALLEVSREPK